MKKVLVYGWYHHHNIGDELFMDAFRHLLPELDFVFTDHINETHLQNVDAVFFGGGSFLGDCPKITDTALSLLKGKKIFYVGVGLETDIHDIHQQLIANAQLIVTRTLSHIAKVQKLSSNVMYAPDLVYCLHTKINIPSKRPSSILVLPNANVIPTNNDSHWKHAAWGYFKSEISQLMDCLLEGGHQIRVAAFSAANEIDDRWAVSELVSQMSRRDNSIQVQEVPATLDDAVKLFSQFSLIITQRYHGIVLAEITKTPFISIYHHDKLKASLTSNGQYFSYYGFTKKQLIDAVSLAFQSNNDYSLPIEPNMYEEIRKRIMILIE